MSIEDELLKPDNLFAAFLQAINKSNHDPQVAAMKACPVKVVGTIDKEIRSQQYTFAYQGLLVETPTFAASGSHWPILRGEKKPRGVVRLSARDRIVQRALLNVIQPSVIEKIDNPVAYGNKTLGSSGSARGIGLMAADVASARSELGGDVLRVDISKFFPSIDRTQLLERLRVVLRDDSCDWLFLSYLNSPTTLPPRCTKEDIAKFWPAGKGVAQGTLLASLLSSIYLEEFDRSLLADGLRAFRYVDDLLIVCGDRDPKELFRIVRARLDAIGLSIPNLSTGTDGKCYIAGSDETITAVGYQIQSNGRLLPSANSQERIVRNFVLGFVKENGDPKEQEFCKAAFIGSQRLESYYHVFAGSVHRSFWSVLDSRIAKCSRDIISKFPTLGKFRSRADSKELMHFLGIPRLGSLRSKDDEISDQQFEEITSDMWDPGMSD